MLSLKKLYKVGPGPSSSHTIAPQLAAKEFQSIYKYAHHFKVNLYGSLATTGKGHLTDYIIQKTLHPQSCEVKFIKEFLPVHPNVMDFFAYDENNHLFGEQRYFSLGGGRISMDPNGYVDANENIFPFESMKQICEAMELEHCSLVELVLKYEGEALLDYLNIILNQMFQCVERGLENEGFLPGELNLERVAKKIFMQAQILLKNNQIGEGEKILISSYAYAVSEENACGGDIVTAPTCGASGVLPAVLYFYYQNKQVDRSKLLESLIVGGVFGNLIKHNASISGAIGGCQAEIGTAVSMASAAISHILGLNLEKIEYAAEVAMEHHLGLTCDPVLGYVQIPCIERNAVGALRAYDAALFGKNIGIFRKNRVSFDEIVTVMHDTGNHLAVELKETSLGGLAKKYNKNK